MKASIVIPAYNEEQAVGPVVAELRNVLDSHGIEAEIIVVDDGSADKTAQAAAAAGARVLRHRSNRGYGAALKSGIAAASNDSVVITDADGTYPCKYIPEMLARLETADMVVGARIGANVQIPLVRKPAKWVLNRLANYMTNAKIPDLNSGLRAFRRNVAMQYFAMLPDQFSWTTTITLAMHCDKYAVVYLPHRLSQAANGESKIVPWDAGSFAILILRTAMLFRPLRVLHPRGVALPVVWVREDGDRYGPGSEHLRVGAAGVCERFDRPTDRHAGRCPGNAAGPPESADYRCPHGGLRGSRRRKDRGRIRRSVQPRICPWWSR